MSSAAQALLVVAAATVFIIRLVAALYHAHVDGQIAARRERQP
ncbi:hypothetical protein [Amycolatopsis orientalis]|nr:hypothetical protein [Amycolatopsis orientalis]